MLTPVKNEEWILKRFLSVTSQIADHIIIADQKSTDKSIDICKGFSKVHVIQNNSNDYDEAYRQQLLLDTARKLYGTGHILLALDADEIMAANALLTQDWQKMLEAEPGTVLHFEKPTFVNDFNNVIRYKNGWPLGYIDDGAEHSPDKIHSDRLPNPENATQLFLRNIKVLHYVLLREQAQKSKQRMYAMIENIHNTKSLRHRRNLYYYKKNYITEGDDFGPVNTDWIKGWQDKGIDMTSIPKEEIFWYDYECLRLFNKYGSKRFWLEDIWNVNWEFLRRKAIDNDIEEIPSTPIKSPPWMLRVSLSFAFNIMNLLIISLRPIKNSLNDK